MVKKYTIKSDLEITTPEEVPKAYEKYGSLKAIWRETGTPWNRVKDLYYQAVNAKLMAPVKPGTRSREESKNTDTTPIHKQGNVRAIKPKPLDAEPDKDGIKRYFFTCAQNNTAIFEPLWKNMQVLAEYYNAKIVVARFTYMKRSLGGQGDKELIANPNKAPGKVDEFKWDERIVPHIVDERCEVARGLIWCGEMNILPTAVNPLSGFETYTRRESGIFPHAKMALQSIASNKNDPTKFNYTTGCITQRNYIHKKAGLKGEFHHTYGFLLVEIDKNDNWFARQVIADDNGQIYDLDVKVSAGKLTTGNRIEAIYWGDGHFIEADETAVNIAFGKNGIKDQLKPKYDYIGDVISFRARSHHEIKDPHLMYMHHVTGNDPIEKELKLTIDILKNKLYRQWCKTNLVYGNHERHLGRWLKEQDGRKDPVNALFWMNAQKKGYEYIKQKSQEPNWLEIAFDVVDPDVVKLFTFLLEDQSSIVCRNRGGGIECGMHGDRGPKGAKGTASNLSRMGRKICIGDKHSAEIKDGVFVSGTFSRLDTYWAKGPSNWSHSHTVIYPNGKRAIITCWNGYFAAGRTNSDN